MSWLLIVLLVVGVLLVVFGLFQLFRSSCERNRVISTQMVRSNNNNNNNLHGAPHVPVTAGAEQQAWDAATGGQTEFVDERKDPRYISPTASDGLTFVFYHATWCGHCKNFLPIYHEVASEIATSNSGRVKFWKVAQDVLVQSTEPPQVPIRAFPTVAVFKDGKYLEHKLGGQAKQAFKEFVLKHIS
jgi:thiol-disulfide isomerase/thioredoxin